MAGHIVPEAVIKFIDYNETINSELITTNRVNKSSDIIYSSARFNFDHL